MSVRIGTLRINLAVDLKAFEKGLNRASRSLTRVSRKLEGTGRRLTTGLTVPVLAAGTAAVTMATRFDDSMNKIVSLVGVGREQVDAWRKDVLKLGIATGKGPLELAEGLFFVTSAGARGSEAMRILAASAQASAVGLGSVSVVADAVTSAMNAYGAETLNAAQATSILVAAVREGKAGAETIAPVLGRILPIASELGVSFDQVAATVAAMTRIGADASQSITGLTNIFKTMLKPGKDAQKILAEVGLSAASLRKSIREDGLLVTLRTLRDRFKGNEDAMSKLFEDFKGMTAVLSLVGKNADQVQTIFDSLAATTEKDLAKAFEESKTSGFRLRQSLATLQAVAIILGDRVLPLVVNGFTKFAGIVNLAVGEFTKLTPQTQNLVIAFTALAAIGGPVLLAMSAIAGGLALIISPMGFVAVLAAGTATLILLRWEKLREGFDIILTELGKKLDTFAVKFNPIVLALKGLAWAAGASLNQVGDELDSFGVNGDATKKVISSILEDMESDFDRMAKSVTDGLFKPGEALASMAKSAEESAARIKKSIESLTGGEAGDKRTAKMMAATRAAEQMGIDLTLEATASKEAIFESSLNKQIEALRVAGASKKSLELAQSAVSLTIAKRKQSAEAVFEKERMRIFQSTSQFIASSALANNKKLAGIARAAAVANATINTFRAANVALASAPPPFNFALAAAVVAAGLANVARITRVPGFKHGGRHPVGEPFMVGEDGPEVRVENTPGTIIPMNKLAAAGAGGGGFSFGISIDTVNTNGVPGSGQALAKELEQIFLRPSGLSDRIARMIEKAADKTKGRAT